ncbi:hypothetical protein [Pendulispora albinea]|uniref:PEGA domain-containing protein n=1 Tax=Pendulispora albinea TaxID=2741071 RepID=A0ABZ2MBC3_9BACT
MAATTFEPHSAVAQPSAPSARARRDAAEHNKRAFEAIRRADADTARLEFLQAYALVPTSGTLWNLLVAEADSNRPLDALKRLRVYLTDPSLEPAKQARAKGLLLDLASRVGHLQINAPDEVTVTLDGMAVSREQRKESIDVAPGKHVVEAALDTGTQRREVDLAAGNETTVSFEPPPKDPPKAAASVVAPPPPAHDAAPRAPTTGSGAGGSPPAATWILGGVAVAALGAGVAFSLSARSKRDELGDDFTACRVPDSPSCANLHDLRDAASRNATLGWIGYGVSGAAAVTGGLIWLLSPRKPVERAARVIPLTSPGMAGVRFQTSF